MQALRLCEFEYFCDVIALSVLCAMNYIISQLLHYTTRALTDINDLGKAGCPRTVSGCALDTLLGQLDFPAVINVG